MRGSKADLPVALETEQGTIRVIEWGDMNLEVGAFEREIDPSPFFKGLPDDRCQSPHWGYVVKGQLRFHFADHDEVYNAGDAYYAPPGHTAVIGDNTEYVEFSPAGPYQQTMEVVGRNLAALRAEA
ncbi:MAG: cupin domain-containing protein [Ktedonobacterales bacterium]